LTKAHELEAAAEKAIDDENKRNAGAGRRGGGRPGPSGSS
jgi:hypothetical protein